MEIEDYFDVLAPDDIRLRGSRVGIETVLYEYVHRKQTAEEIAQALPTLTLEQVYATILYYLRNREAVEAYLADWLEWSHQVREEQRRNPPPHIARLSRITEVLSAAGLTAQDYLHDAAVRRRVDEQVLEEIAQAA